MMKFNIYVSEWGHLTKKVQLKLCSGLYMLLILITSSVSDYKTF